MLQLLCRNYAKLQALDVLARKSVNRMVISAYLR
jgi:hypothetical protein